MAAAARPPHIAGGAPEDADDDAPADPAAFRIQYVRANFNARAAARNAAALARLPGGAGGPAAPPGPAGNLPAPPPQLQGRDPLMFGVLRNEDVERMPVQAASGVPGEVANDNDPYGREFFRRERERVIHMYLDPYVNFVRHVAGRCAVDYMSMINDASKSNPMLGSLFAGIDGAQEAAASVNNNRIPGAGPAGPAVPVARAAGAPVVGAGGAGAGAAAGAGAGAGGAAAPGGGAGAVAGGPGGNNDNGGDRNNAVVLNQLRGLPTTMPTNSQWHAFYWLLHQPRVTKEQIKMVTEMFSTEAVHNVSHIQSPLQCGWTICNEQFIASLSSALFTLRVDWRPDLASALTIANIITNDDLMLFVASIVAYYFNKHRYNSSKMHIAGEVKRQIDVDLRNLHNQADALTLVNGRIVFGPIQHTRPRVDVRAMYAAMLAP